MFPSRYFADRMFAPRYFPKTGADPVIVATAPASRRVVIPARRRRVVIPARPRKG